MLNQSAQLTQNMFDTPEMVPTRDGFGHGVVEAGGKNANVIVLCADLAESTRSHWFKEKFPDRYIEVGVAEQNLAAIGSGFANYGKIPFIASYAAFNPGRNNEQIRTTVAINNVPVKICGMHAGISVGPDGATHQALEDIGLMRMLPNMTVIVPADAEEGRKATIAVAENGAPTYLRFGREKTPIMTTAATPFEIGKAYSVWDSDSPQVALIACGALLYNALAAAKKLEENGINAMVINNHTIKPLDQETILAAAGSTGAVVTVEEHQVHGGLGGAVAELLAEQHPVPIEFIGVRDRFGQSGETGELMQEYGLDTDSIVAAAKKVISRK